MIESSKMPSSNLLPVKVIDIARDTYRMAMSIKLPPPAAPFSNITRDHYLYSCVKDKEGKNLLSSENVLPESPFLPPRGEAKIRFRSFSFVRGEVKISK